MSMKKSLFGMLVVILMVAQAGFAGVVYNTGFDGDMSLDGWTTVNGGPDSLVGGYAHNEWRTDTDHSVLNLTYAASQGTTKGIQRSIALAAEPVESLTFDLMFTVNTNVATDIYAILDLGDKQIDIIHQPWASKPILVTPGSLRPGPDDFAFLTAYYYHAIVEIGATQTVITITEEKYAQQDVVVASCTVASVTTADIGSSLDVTLQQITQASGTSRTVAFLDNLSVTTVPEPATMSLLGLGSLLFCGKKQ